MSDDSYIAERDEDVMLNNLFSKYGFIDGDHPAADKIHAAFSQHLENHGYENTVVGSVHNRRVVSINVNGQPGFTDLLPWGNEWSLIVKPARPGSEEETIPVPEDLKKLILDFLPTAYDMMHDNS